MRKLTFGLILMAVVSISVIAGCGDGGGGAPADPGTLKLFIDQLPFAGLESLTVNVSRLDIVKTPELGNKALEEIVTLSSQPLTLNFVGLPGLTPSAVGEYPGVEPGFITQIRFIVDSAFAEINGVKTEVKIPSGPQTGIKVISADIVIEIKDNVKTSVTVRLDTEKSIINNEGQGMIFKPVLHAILGEVTSLPINEFVPQQIMVLFKPDITREQVETLNTQIGATILSKSPYSNRYLMFLPETVTMEQARTFYDASDLVSVAVPNYIGTVTQIQRFPNESQPPPQSEGLFLEQWALHNTGQNIHGITAFPDADIDAPEAWGIQIGSDNVVVAVLDTGVDLDHPDLSTNIYVNFNEIPFDGVDNDGNGFVDDVQGWDFVNDLPNPVVPGTMISGGSPNDDADHGSRVAGIIGAQGNNSIGVVGVNWFVSIMPLKIGGPQPGGLPGGNSNDYFDGLEYAVANGADIINQSLSFILTNTDDINRLTSIFNSHNSPSVLHVVSADNQGRNIDNKPEFWFPAELTNDNIIVVANTNMGDALNNRPESREPDSNFGPTSVDLAAPGKFVLSTNNAGGYSSDKSGTSFAAPHVAGAAGLILAQCPTLKGNPLEIKKRILDNVDPVQNLQVVTGGRLNAYRALQGGQC